MRHVREMGECQSEFFALPVHFFSPSSRDEYARHIIYCKKHTIRKIEAGTPEHRTLFSLGWPPYCSSSEVEAVFSRVGYVTSTYMQNSAGPINREALCCGKGGRVAYVVFSQSKELNQGLRMCADGQAVRCDIGKLGMGKWCEEYAVVRLTETVLNKAVSCSVGQYDKNEAKQHQTRRTLSQPDSDGWVTVARRRPFPPNVSRKKRKEKKLVNFYQFQQREGQREAIAALRKKFQTDKERVAELRAQRRFKPF